MKEKINLDKEKLKVEDRRFLLNKSLTELITNYQGSMYNVSLTISLLALLLAGFSLIYQTQNIQAILLYFILSLIGYIIYLIKFKRIQRELKKEIKISKKDYKDLFKYHLGYATKIRKEE